MHILPSSLASISGVANDIYPFDLVHLITTNDGYRVEATNGKVAVVVEGQYPTAASKVAVPPSMIVEDTGNEALIPVNDWEKIFTYAAKWKGLPECREVLVTIAKNEVYFSPRHPDISFITTVQQVDYRFPNIDAVTPDEKPVISVTLQANLLQSLLKSVTGILGKDAKLTFNFVSKEKPVVVRGQSESQKVTALIMPCL